FLNPAVDRSYPLLPGLRHPGGHRGRPLGRQPVPGHRAGCCGHHHGLLLLLPGGQELQDHGVLQEHGAPGEGGSEGGGWEQEV
ncbi:unnamed protein product, partial [Gulo gulo]